MPEANNTYHNNKNSSFIQSAYGGFIDWLHAFIVGIRKNLVTFLICCLITTGFLTLGYINKKDVYKSSFTVSYDDLVRKIYGDRLQKIDILAKRKEYNSVAKFLGVSPATAATLMAVEGKNILGQDLTEDMNTDRIPFTVTITVKDNRNIAALQDGLVHFLETGNAYMVVKKEVKMREVDEELQYIDAQLKMMDSLKKLYNAGSFVAIAHQNAEKSPITTIYHFSYELYKRKQELLRKKSMPSNLQVLDDAIVSKRVQYPYLFVIILGLITGTVLYIFVQLFIIPIFRGRRV